MKSMTDGRWEKIKHPKMRYDPELDKYEGKIFFPKIWEECVETMKRTGFPELLPREKK